MGWICITLETAGRRRAGLMERNHHPLKDTPISGAERCGGVSRLTVGNKLINADKLGFCLV